MNALKRIISSLLAVLMTISVMIKDGKFGKVELVVTDEVTTESEKIELEIHNYSGKKVGFGYDYSVEMLKGNKWEKLPLCGGFNEPYIIINRFGVFKQSIDIEKMFGQKLETGEYRVIKSLKIGKDSKDFVAYFTVAEAPAQEGVTAVAA